MKTRLNILVTGANGQLGNCLRRCTADSADNYIYTDVAELDITDQEAVMQTVVDNDIDVIVNCAAYTNVDRAESDAATARLLNATAVRNLAEAAKAHDATLIHVSTDYVFGGTVGNLPWTEADVTSPTGVYGQTKLEGEQAIDAVGCKAVTIRTAWLYSEFGKNFVKTMLNLTATKPALNVVFDQAGSPTYAGDLAAAIARIIAERSYQGNEGLYHYSNEGVCSWYDFTQLIARLAGNTDCRISPCHSDEFPSPVKRPAYSVLDKTKFKTTFGQTIPYWLDSLQTCINNLKNEA